MKRKVLVALICIVGTLSLKAQVDSDFIKAFLAMSEKIDKKECMQYDFNDSKTGYSGRAWIDNQGNICGPVKIGIPNLGTYSGLYFDGKLTYFGQLDILKDGVPHYITSNWKNNQMHGWTRRVGVLNNDGVLLYYNNGSAEGYYNYDYSEDGFFSKDGKSVSLGDSLKLKYEQLVETSKAETIKNRSVSFDNKKCLFTGALKNGKPIGWGFIQTPDTIFQKKSYNVKVYKKEDMRPNDTIIIKDYEWFGINLVRRYDTIAVKNKQFLRMLQHYDEEGARDYVEMASSDEYSSKYYRAVYNPLEGQYDELLDVQPPYRVNYQFFNRQWGTEYTNLNFEKHQLFKRQFVSIGEDPENKRNPLMKAGYEVTTRIGSSNVSIEVIEWGYDMEMKQYWYMDENGKYTHVKIIDNGVIKTGRNIPQYTNPLDKYIGTTAFIGEGIYINQAFYYPEIGLAVWWDEKADEYDTEMTYLPAGIGTHLAEKFRYKRDILPNREAPETIIFTKDGIEIRKTWDLPNATLKGLRERTIKERVNKAISK